MFVLNRSFPYFYPTPLSESEAINANYTLLMDCSDSGSPGNVYIYENDIAMMPFYNLYGEISGVMIGMDDPGKSVQKAPWAPITTSENQTFWALTV